jgi:hypothetical protein
MGNKHGNSFILGVPEDVRLAIFLALDDWNSRDSWRCTCKTFWATYRAAKDRPLDFYRGVPIVLNSGLIDGGEAMRFIANPVCAYGPMFAMRAILGTESNVPKGWEVPGKKDCFRPLENPSLYRIWYSRGVGDDGYPWVSVKCNDDDSELDLASIFIEFPNECCLCTSQEGNIVHVYLEYTNARAQHMFTLDISGIKHLDQLIDAMLAGGAATLLTISDMKERDTMERGIREAQQARTRGSFEKYIAYLGLKKLHQNLFGDVNKRV